MNRNHHRITSRIREFTAALALVALAAFGAPGLASANTTADSTILNVVTVDYKDAGGAASFSATASALVTVNLVPSALAKGNAPSAGDPDGSAGPDCPDTSGANKVTSGNTFESLFALTATANGDDSYTLGTSNTPTNASGVTVTHQVYTYNSANFANEGALASRTFGSAVVVGSSAANTLEFPGGALLGFEIDDIAVIDGVAYVVTAVDPGNAAGHDNLGNTAHSDVGVDTTETQGYLTLAALPVTNISINGANVAVGSNTAPSFSAANVGQVVGEMVLVKISVTATANVPGSDGSVAYTLTATDGANPTTISCTVTFAGAALAIQKDVRNFTDSGAFGATATGDPGDILEYRVTITNTGGNATQVVVTDPVPVYTTLVPGPYNSGAAFAQIYDGTNTVNVTASAADSETQPGAPTETGYGNTTGTVAGSLMTFYVGDTSTNAAGGIVTSADTYTIIYQVTID